MAHASAIPLYHHELAGIMNGLGPPHSLAPIGSKLHSPSLFPLATGGTMNWHTSAIPLYPHELAGTMNGLSPPLPPGKHSQCPTAGGRRPERRPWTLRSRAPRLRLPDTCASPFEHSHSAAHSPLPSHDPQGGAPTRATPHRRCAAEHATQCAHRPRWSLFR